jgi:hypothetical protein
LFGFKGNFVRYCTLSLSNKKGKSSSFFFNKNIVQLLKAFVILF